MHGFTCLAPALARANDGFKAEVFDELARLEEHNFWFEARNRLIAWALQRHFPAARSFLEIGCGTGFVLAMLARRFPHLALYGSEIYCRGLEFARQRVPQASLFQMDAGQMPFADQFDLIGAFDVLEHIEDDVTVLHEMHRALHPGGGILLTVPQHPFLWSAFDDYAEHKRRYTRRELLEKISAAGFHIRHVNSFCFLLLPLMLLSRLRQQKLDENYQPLSELRIHPLLNTIFRRTLDLERALLRLGFRYPAGGTLVVLAERPTS